MARCANPTTFESDASMCATDAVESNCSGRSMKWTMPAPSSIAMSILAQGQLGAGKRVKGRLSTRGVVGLALELSGDASSLALQCELDATGAKAPPKFGATLQLSP